MIEYNESLNLSIDKVSRKPAIEVVSMDTETGTYTAIEESDSDQNRKLLQILISVCP